MGSAISPLSYWALGRKTGGGTWIYLYSTAWNPNREGGGLLPDILFLLHTEHLSLPILPPHFFPKVSQKKSRNRSLNWIFSQGALCLGGLLVPPSLQGTCQEGYRSLRNRTCGCDGCAIGNHSSPGASTMAPEECPTSSFLAGMC